MQSSIVNHHYRGKSDVPNEVLSCHHFVEGYKRPSLHGECEEEIVVEGNSCCYHNAPLRYEHEDCKDFAGLHSIVHLVDHVEVHTEVVTVIFANEMVQVPFVKEFPSINLVEKACEHQKGRSRDNGEDQAVAGEKV